MGLFYLGYKQLLNSFLMTKMNLWTLFYKLKRFFGPMAIPGGEGEVVEVKNRARAEPMVPRFPIF